MTATPPDHIVKSFDEELRRLQRTLTHMGGLCEDQLAQAINALGRRDSELAERVIAADLRVDTLHQEVDELVIRLLALRQPLAYDLRVIVTGLRMAAELERMGDYAANVAKRTIVLNQLPSLRAAQGVVRMGRLVQSIVKDVLDAFTDLDPEKAWQVWNRDEEVDDLYNALFRETITYMMEDPRNISAAAHVLFMAKNIERIGDHATNIAEIVYFVAKGEHLTEQRPKSDNTSFAVITPPPSAPTSEI